MKSIVNTILIAAFILAGVSLAASQNDIPKRVNQRPAANDPNNEKPAALLDLAADTDSQPRSGKRNGRPTVVVEDAEPKTTERTGAEYKYEFSQPAFTIDRIIIEHDETGRGTITFHRQDYGEPITDPMAVSRVTLDRLNAAFEALDFLNSSEDYQYEKDYSHLGNVSITLDRGGRERTAKFNWTENRQAKLIFDEYRKLGNQYIWIFDINVARQNQPLEAPKIIGRLDSFLRRNEISDPPHIVPFLEKLSNDERIPLIARNHALRLIQRIAKSKKN
jgi:hypothetical protein